MLNSVEFSSALAYMVGMLARIIPLLFIAVFLAEFARIKLGGDRLRRLLSGTHPWDGRLRGAFLGALMPYCECGAFPVMLGLLRAGVPMGTVLAFFIVSPLVSIPAFLILLGILGPAVAFLYLAMAVTCGLTASVLLERWGERGRILKEGFLGVKDGAGCCENNATVLQGESACGVAENSLLSRSVVATSLYPAWRNTWNTVRRILPYVLAAIVLTTLIHVRVSTQQLEKILTAGGPFDVFIAALAGIPFYACTSTTISVVAPLIRITGAAGPGVAFIIAAAGTSINGIIFMNSIFQRRFIAVFVLYIFLIAVLTGYVLQGVL